MRTLSAPPVIVGASLGGMTGMLAIGVGGLVALAGLVFGAIQFSSWFDEKQRLERESARLKAEALDREIAQLKAVRTRLGNSGVQLETASVVGIDPTRREGLVRINAGLRQGVHRDAAVIIHGDILGGIVANDPGEFVSLVKPAQRCSLSVRLYPADGVDAGLNPSAYPGTVLKPIDGGLWIGDIASDVEIREGQIARITDEALKAGWKTQRLFSSYAELLQQL